MGAGVAWGYHIGLQQGAFQVDVVVTQSLVDSSQHLQQGGTKVGWGEAGRGYGGQPQGPQPSSLAHLTAQAGNLPSRLHTDSVSSHGPHQGGSRAPRWAQCHSVG